MQNASCSSVVLESYYSTQTLSSVKSKIKIKPTPSRGQVHVSREAFPAENIFIVDPDNGLTEVAYTEAESQCTELTHSAAQSMLLAL